MNALPITLRQLEYVVALGERLHFGRAAEACFVSQPALSTQLKSLEAIVGVPLFERGRHEVRLTRAGEEFLPRARTILRDSQELWEGMLRFRNPLSGPLHLGVIPSIAPFLLPRVLPAIRQRFSEMVPHLYEDKTHVLVEKLEAGALDVIIAALPFPLRSLEVEPLFEDPFYLAMARDHPLASFSSVSLNQLEGEEILLLEEGHCLRGHALNLCDLARRTRMGNVRATSLSTLLSMVAEDLGLTLVPRLLVEASSPDSALEFRPIEEKVARRRIALVWRSISMHGDAFRELGQTVTAAGTMSPLNGSDR